MTRFVIDEPAFRALVRGETLSFANHEVVMNPRLGWVTQLQALVDAIRAPRPGEEAHRLAVGAVPPDPPQAREFLPNPPPRRR